MAQTNKKSSFGPGFLVTAAFIGPGTVTTCTLAGANFGFALIFSLLFAVITTLILQEMTGRLSLASGKDLGQSLREYPQHRWTKALFILLTLSSITIGCAAYEAGNIIGGSLGLEMVTGIPQKIWVALISLIAVFLLGKKKYRLVERVLIVLVFLMSVSFLSTAIIMKPDIGAVLKGFIPSFPEDSLYLVLALVGTTVVPYNLFLHSAAVKEKWRSIERLKDVRRDLVVSISLGGLISVSIVITSAMAFYAKGVAVESGAQMASQLQPLFGSVANVLFGIGFFAAGMSSAVTAPYAAAFASSGVLGWQEGQNSKRFRAVWLGVILVGVTVSLFNFSPIGVIVFAQVANGLFLPVASIFLLIVLNSRRILGDAVNTWRQNILGGAIVVIVSLLGLWNIYKLLI
jgi:NRAMP (natural resistance-associated macrophage protein)-like metal ion transporter